MRSVTGRIHSVESFGTLDGPGIRYVLFLQGCPLRCLYCHNPDTWHRERGREIRSEEAVADIVRYRRFLTNGGVTLSGGEPLMQPDFAAAVLEGCREQGLHTALDTSGAVPLLSCRGAVEQADQLRWDIKAADNTQLRRQTGRGMENTLELLDYCENVGKPVWIRHVLVPGLTMEDGQLHRLGRRLQPYACIQRVEVLPFHKMGEYKWKELGEPYTLEKTEPPSPEEAEKARALLREYGLEVH